MADPYLSTIADGSTFGRVAKIVAPGATDLDPIPKSVVLLAAGDVTIVPVGNANGVTLAFVGLPAGYIIPFQVRRVTVATATVATIES